MSTHLRRRDTDHDHDPNTGDLAQILATNPRAGSSQSSFSFAVRRNDTTLSKRRRSSDGLTRRNRTDHVSWSTETSSGPHSRSRTVDDELALVERASGFREVAARAGIHYGLRPAWHRLIHGPSITIHAPR
ncbi:hypothetical protein V8D89_006591 [Ganoderma adspersum]